MVAGAEIVGRVRPEQPVGQKARDVDALGVDGGEPVDQRGAEVEVDVMRAARELALLRARLGLGLLARRTLPRRAAGDLALAALALARLCVSAQVLDGARDR